MARKLRFFREHIMKAGFSPSTRFKTEADINLVYLEVKLGEFEAEMREMNSNKEKLQCAYNELLEYKLVLQKEMSTDLLKQVKLGSVSGLIPREKLKAFERIIFHATRGNVFLKQAVVEDSVTDLVSGEKVEKNAFVVFYSGERAKNKILKICDAFGANCYPFTDDLGKQYQMIRESVEEVECHKAYDLAAKVYMPTFDRTKPPGEDYKKDAFIEAYLQCSNDIQSMKMELKCSNACSFLFVMALLLMLQYNFGQLSLVACNIPAPN